MFSPSAIDYSDRAKFYSELLSELGGLVGGNAGVSGEAWFTNLANASALLMSNLPRLNWVGFYLANGEELVLGPFQGLPACLRIPFGKGVCGAAARDREAVLVDDVEKFPGHIACDARSRSELVLPLILETPKGSRVLGVLDLDSPETERFDERDVAGLLPIVQLLVSRTVWPQTF
jgi:L-methionine (R)-S-oxide reductase